MHKIPLPFDFYLPDHNMYIEFDGTQHFFQADFFECNLEDQRKKDLNKNKHARENKIHMLRIPFWLIEDVSEILKSLFENFQDYDGIIRPTNDYFEINIEGIESLNKQQQIRMIKESYGNDLKIDMSLST